MPDNDCGCEEYPCKHTSELRAAWEYVRSESPCPLEAASIDRMYEAIQAAENALRDKGTVRRPNVPEL